MSRDTLAGRREARVHAPPPIAVSRLARRGPCPTEAAPLLLLALIATLIVLLAPSRSLGFDEAGWQRLRGAIAPVEPPIDDADRSPRWLSLEEVLRALPRPAFLAGVDERKSPEADELDPPSLEAQHAYVDARLALAEGAVRDARRLAERAAELAPDWPEPLELQLRLQQALGDRSGRSRTLRELAEMDPRNASSLLLLGLGAAQRGQPADAVHLFHESLRRLGREDVETTGLDADRLRRIARQQLTAALLALKHDAAAVDAAMPLLEGAGEGAELETERLATLAVSIGDAAMRLGRFDDALRLYDAVAAPGSRSALAPAPLGARRVLAATSSSRPARAVVAIVEHFRAHPDASLPASLLKSIDDQAGETSLLKRLRDQYGATPGPGLLLAVLRLLPVAEADRFLVEAIARRPADAVAFTQWIAERDRAHRPTPKLMRAAIQLVARDPDWAERIASTPASDLLLDAIADRPARGPRGWAVLWLRHRLQREWNQTEPAIASAEGLARRKAAPEPVRLDVARWLGGAPGRIEQAMQVLDSIPTPSVEARLLRVELLLRWRDLAAAERALDTLLADHPDDGAVRLLEARMAGLTSGTGDADLDSLRAWFAGNPSNEKAFRGLMDLYRSADSTPANAAGRSEAIRAHLAAAPGSRAGRLERAVLLLAMRPDLAERELRSLLDDRVTPRPLTALLQFLASRGRVDEAGRLIREAVATVRRDEPDQALFIAQAAMRAVQGTDAFREAAQAMTTVLARRPATIERITLHAMLLETLEQREQALRLVLRHLEDAAAGEATRIERAPLVNIALRLLRGMEQAGDVDPERLATWRRNVVEHALAPTPSGKRDAASVALVAFDRFSRQGDAEPALSLIRTSSEAGLTAPEQLLPLAVRIELGPDPGGDAAGESDAAEEPGAAAWRDAIQRWTRLLIADAPDAEAELRFTAASLLLERDLTELGETEMAELRESHPEHPGAANHVGYRLADRGERLDAAKQKIEVAVRAKPWEAAYVDSMGWVLYKLGDFEAATRWLRRAAALPGGDHPEVLSHLGDAMWRLGLERQAERVWREAARLHARRYGDGEAGPDWMRSIGDGLTRRLEALDAGETPPVAPTAPGSADAHAASGVAIP